MTRATIHFPDAPLFSHEIPIRITDINYGNHLAHDALISVLHEARARFFKSMEMEEGDCDGVGIILVDLAVSYRAQAYFGETLVVEIAVPEITSRGCEILYRVTENASERVVALARTGLVFFDYSRNRVAGTPARFRKAIAD